MNFNLREYAFDYLTPSEAYYKKLLLIYDDSNLQEDNQLSSVFVPFSDY